MDEYNWQSSLDMGAGSAVFHSYMDCAAGGKAPWIWVQDPRFSIVTWIVQLEEKLLGYGCRIRGFP
jgi:hypothetical protein